MSVSSVESTPFYKYDSLMPAEPDLMTAFTYGTWAGMSVLFVDIQGVRSSYVPISKTASGFSYYRGDNQKHPLHEVEEALRQDTYLSNQSLRRLSLLSYQVGQIADETRGFNKVGKQERETIDMYYKNLQNTTLNRPKKSWKRADFVKYYRSIRALEAVRLEEQVTVLAGLIPEQNTQQQLFVAKVHPEGNRTGWLAPLVGLCIETKENDYYYQVHDVLPVIRQADVRVARLHGANSNLYIVRKRDFVIANQ